METPGIMRSPNRAMVLPDQLTPRLTTMVAIPAFSTTDSPIHIVLWSRLT